MFKKEKGKKKKKNNHLPNPPGPLNRVHVPFVGANSLLLTFPRLLDVQGEKK